MHNCAQSFSNSFEGVHGVVRKSGRGSSFCVLTFIGFLCYNFSKSIEGVQEVPPTLPPVCIDVSVKQIENETKLAFVP